LLKAIETMNLATYWPSDNKKIPDLLDFSIIKGIPKDFCRTESCLKLSSDHSPVIFTINSKIMIKNKLTSSATPKQNGPIFKSY